MAAYWIIEDHGFGGQDCKCSIYRESWNDIYEDVSSKDFCPACGEAIEHEKTIYDEGMQSYREDKVAPVVDGEKIKNGGKLSIGQEREITLVIDQHFNWFQKLMWNWCFGIKVEDYREE